MLFRLAERDTDPAGRAPDNTALFDYAVIGRKLEVAGDRDRSGENQARSGFREIAQSAIDADPKRRDQDPGALEHSLSLCLSLVLRPHADNLTRSDYFPAN